MSEPDMPPNAMMNGDGWPHGDGEMACRIRALNWAATPLGAIGAWPQSMRTAVELMLATPGPATLLWGSGHLQLYNDAYIAVAKGRHPGLLGRAAREGWPDAFDDVIAPLLRKAQAGQTTRLSDYPVTLLGADGQLEQRTFDTDWLPVRDETGAVAGALQTLTEVTARNRAEATLRETQARQTFLLALSDRLRIEEDPRRIAAVAVGLIATHLNLDRAYVAQVDKAADRAEIGPEYRLPDLAPVEGTLTLSDFPEAFARVEAATLILSDAAADRTLSDSDKRGFAAFNMGALVVASARKGAQNPVWALLVATREPRHWTMPEVALIEEVAERTWAAMERAKIEAARRASEERFRALATAGTYSVYRMSPDWRLMYHLDGRGVLEDTYEPADNWASRYIPAEDQPSVFAAIGAAIRSRSLFELEHRVRRANGAVGWVFSRAVPILGPDGEIVEWFGAASDVTARRQAEAAVRASDERFRAMAEAIEDVFYVTDLDHNALTYLSPGYERVWGRPRAQLEADLASFIETIHPDDHGKFRDGKLAQAQGAPVTTEYRVLRPDGEIRWVLDRCFPIPSDGTTRLSAGVASDITERHLAQERQKVLVAELQHRTRNLITVVSALSRQTLKSSVSLDDFGGQFGDRLSALSRVQGLLSHLSAGKRVAFDDLLRSELTALGAPDHKVTLEGPSGVPLRSTTVQTFSLALHELATNALKYGALAVPGGHLTVRWSVRSFDRNAHRLLVDWRETGVDMTHVGDRSRGGGYGRELIERALPYQMDARTSYEMTREGVHCTIEVATPMTLQDRSKA